MDFIQKMWDFANLALSYFCEVKYFEFCRNLEDIKLLNGFAKTRQYRTDNIERARETSPDDDAEYPVFSDADPRFSKALIRLDTRKRRKWRNVGQGLEGREPIQFS